MFCLFVFYFRKTRRIQKNGLAQLKNYLCNAIEMRTLWLLVFPISSYLSMAKSKYNLGRNFNQFVISHHLIGSYELCTGGTKPVENKYKTFIDKLTHSYDFASWGDVSFLSNQ